MEIYIVQDNDTIEAIAEKFGVTTKKLIQDNGIKNPERLVVGQTIVIAYPKEVHIVQEGDTLESIARTYHVSVMQILRNNAFLSEREFLLPGETLVISYETDRNIVTNGYAYVYLNKNTLIKTLPFLTYLSVFNYRLDKNGKIIPYGNDEEVIRLAGDYGVIPLMMVTPITNEGETDAEFAYKALSDETYQKQAIDEMLKKIKIAGYYGVNIMLSGINEVNQQLYINFVSRASDSMREEGYQTFITMNPNINAQHGQVLFSNINYNAFCRRVDGITFFQYAWGNKEGPPSPVCSIRNMNIFLKYVTASAAQGKIILGKPLIGYDWELPYIPKKSEVNSLTINSCLDLAYDMNAVIQFDEVSQSPYYYYQSPYTEEPVEHVVWFIDARSMKSMNELINQYGLMGSGIWNIMLFNQQLWTVTISQFNIIKLISVI